MIGTTHFINAVVQRRHLTKVGGAAARHAARAPRCRRSATGRRISPTLVRGGVWMVEGGHEYDGRPFMPLDEAAVMKAAAGDEGRGPDVRSASPRSSRRSIPATRSARPSWSLGDLPGRRHHLLVRPGPHRPAGARECRAAERGAGRPVARHDRGLREGDPPIPASTRRCSSPRTTARWPRRSQARRLPVYQLRLRRHQLDARRGAISPASATPW